MTMYCYGHYTYQEIGMQYGVSRQRVQQIVKRNARRLERKIKRGEL